jgi:hypothetical protein
MSKRKNRIDGTEGVFVPRHDEEPDVDSTFPEWSFMSADEEDEYFVRLEIVIRERKRRHDDRMGNIHVFTRVVI